jgi:hypothetical protein
LCIQVGEILDINLPGFFSDTSGDTVFAFETVTQTLENSFTDTLPDRNPEYEKLGCFADVLTDRAVGGGRWSVRHVTAATCKPGFLLCRECFCAWMKV